MAARNKQPTGMSRADPTSSPEHHSANILGGTAGSEQSLSGADRPPRPHPIGEKYQSVQYVAPAGTQMMSTRRFAAPAPAWPVPVRVLMRMRSTPRSVAR